MLNCEGLLTLENRSNSQLANLDSRTVNSKIINLGYALKPSKWYVTSWCFQCTLQDWLRTNHTTLLNTDSLVCDCFVRVCDYFQANPPFDQSSFVAAFVVEFPKCQVGYVNGNPSGSLLGNRSKKPTWRNGFLRATTLPTNKDLRISLCSYTALATQITDVMMILQHPDQRGSPILFPGNLLGPRIRPTFGKELRHHCLLLRPRCNFIHPRQLSPFPERLELPFSSDEILSGYEDIVSSETDQFTAWVKMDPHDTLVHHMVDVQKATADFREASERRLATSSQTNRVSKKISNRSPVQKRAQHLQLEPRAPSRKGRCLRKANRRQVACHHATRSS